MNVVKLVAMMPEKVRSLTPPVGVTEALALGLETVAKNPLLLLLPLILDVMLWMGPRLSFRPLISELSHSLGNGLDPVALTAMVFFLYLGFPMWGHQQVWEPLNPLLADLGQRDFSFSAVTKVLEVLAQTAPDQYLGVFMPSMVAGRDAGPLPFNYVPPVWQIHTPFEVVALRVGLFLVGVVLWSLYLAIVAQLIKEKRSSLGWLVKRVPIVLTQLILLLVMVAVGVFLFFLVLSAIEMLSRLVGVTGIAAFLMLLVILLGTWFVMFAVFTIHGMYMNDRGVFAAVWDSLRVVQWNIASTLSLFIVILILVVAMQFIKGWLDVRSWVIPVGIVANAFLSTGLVAATFVFFKDRYRYWRELREELLAELERRRVQKS
ncbi:MAG: hypothetical protein JXB30_10045 [Anaerolineae bacterium]|nr:hypothetical protein [Anaerolineae bacterium]